MCSFKWPEVREAKKRNIAKADLISPTVNWLVGPNTTMCRELSLRNRRPVDGLACCTF